MESQRTRNFKSFLQKRGERVTRENKTRAADKARQKSDDAAFNVFCDWISDQLLAQGIDPNSTTGIAIAVEFAAHLMEQKEARESRGTAIDPELDGNNEDPWGGWGNGY